MVFRRIREHVAAQNWFAVGIDLAIVFIGVFLGPTFLAVGYQVLNEWMRRAKPQEPA